MKNYFIVILVISKHQKYTSTYIAKKVKTGKLIPVWVVYEMKVLATIFPCFPSKSSSPSSSEELQCSSTSFLAAAWLAFLISSNFLWDISSACKAERERFHFCQSIGFFPKHGMMERTPLVLRPVSTNLFTIGSVLNTHLKATFRTAYLLTTWEKNLISYHRTKENHTTNTNFKRILPKQPRARATESNKLLRRSKSKVIVRNSSLVSL